MNGPVTCPGCGTADRFFEVDKLNDYSVVQCTACTLQFSRPMRSPDGSWYDKAYMIRHSAIDTRIRDYYAWTIRTLPLRGKLLDVGCGEGAFVDYAQRRGFEAYGIDFSSEAIALGRSWYGLKTIFTSSMAEYKNAHSQAEFDIITFFEVLEHLERPAEFLGEIATLLKPGGYIAASVPNEKRWPYRDFGDYPPNHLTRWNARSLRTFINRNGFDALHIDVSSRLRSYRDFLGHFLKRFVYMLFGMYAKGFKAAEPNIGQRIVSRADVKRLFSFLKPRQIRDLLLWPLAAATFPFVFPWFRGGNLMLVAVKRQGEMKQEAPMDEPRGRFSIDRSLNYGRQHIRSFLSAVGTCRTVLDIGAGRGADLKIARECHPKAVLHAIDVCEDRTQVLSDLGVSVHSLNIERDRFPFPDGSVDVVIANQILEHVKELFWIWHEVSRILPVGGSFIIGVPNLAAFHNRVLLSVGKQPTSLKNSSAHVRGFTKHDLLRFLESCFPRGYRLRQFAGSNFYPFPPSLAQPLAALLPNMAWGIFFYLEKTREYHDEFLAYPAAQGLETNFFTGGR